MTVKYDLHRLGWKGFQDLCLTILRQILGQTVESSLDTHDGGQDGAFSGTWRAQDGEDLSGRFVAQCKHTSQADRKLQPSDLADELSKIRKLVAKGRCDTYLLLTNAGLSHRTRSKLTANIEGAGVKCIRYFDTTWINSQIRERSVLRMQVPRLYGLGDLSQILDERAYAQAKAVLASMREDLSKVVLTGTYHKALAALENHRFVLLVGEPAAGKTTIASLLAMAAIDGNNASPLKLDHPSALADHWNPDEPSQLFWLDDAFGVTQYDHNRVLSWNHVLPRLRPMLRTGATIVMTSRDYIYNRVRDSLKDSAFPLLRESQVVVDVRDLTLAEKRQILYNHVRLGDQTRHFRSQTKPCLEGVARHERFTPETARRLADPFFTRSLHLSPHYVGTFVEKQESFLEDVVRGLDTDSKAALALIYVRGGSLESPVKVHAREEQVLRRLGSRLGRSIDALQAMNGSLVLRSDAGEGPYWQFKHPTIGDAFAAFLAAKPEHLTIFVEGSDPEELLNQVTCGEVGVEKAVVLTSDLFPQVLAKLDHVLQDNFRGRLRRPWSQRRDSVLQFLSRRCSKAFLALYLKRNPALLDEVSVPELYLEAMREVDLAARLHEVELLPASHREVFARTVCEYAVTGEDLYPLWSDTIRSVLTDSEFRDMETRIRSEFAPILDNMRYNLESNYYGTEPPEDHMANYVEHLEMLKDHFAEDSSAVKAIEDQEAAVEVWILEHAGGGPPATRPWQSHPTNAPVLDAGERSIFDDIDVD